MSDSVRRQAVAALPVGEYARQGRRDVAPHDDAGRLRVRAVHCSSSERCAQLWCSSRVRGLGQDGRRVCEVSTAGERDKRSQHASSDNTWRAGAERRIKHCPTLRLLLGNMRDTRGKGLVVVVVVRAWAELGVRLARLGMRIITHCKDQGTKGERRRWRSAVAPTMHGMAYRSQYWLLDSQNSPIKRHGRVQLLLRIYHQHQPKAIPVAGTWLGPSAQHGITKN